MWRDWWSLLRRRGAAWTPATPGGLLAEYRFDDGAGDAVTDYSGNGNHGTLGAAGAAPAWAAEGLTFDGGDRVEIPVPIADVKTVVWYGTQTSVSAYNVILSGDQNGSLMWGVNNNTGSYRPNPFFWVGGVGEGLRAVDDTYQRPGGNGIAWVQDGAADKLYVGDGWPCPGATAGAGGDETSATGRTGDLVIGENPGNGALNPFVGTMSGMLLYSAALSAEDAAAALAYLKARATARGMTAYASGYTGRNLWAEGDSLTSGSTITTPWTTTAAGLYVNAYTLRGASGTISQAIDGNTIARIKGGIRSRTLHQRGSGTDVVVIWAGTNDVYIGGRSAAQVFADLDTAIGYAVAAGFKVVTLPMLSRTSSGAAVGDVDAVKTVLNALIDAAGWGANVRVVPAASLDGMTADGAYADTDLFHDGTHPTQAATTDTIAPAIATEVDAFG